jgi:hypothetical protein
MALDTFSGLKTTIADYLNRDDLTSVIPSFITLAEAKFNRKLRVRQMVKRATATLDTQYFAFPSDFLQAKEFQLNTNPITYLQYVTQNQGDYGSANNYVATGRPQFYTIIGTQI